MSRVAALWDEWADEDLFGDGFDALPLGGLVPSSVTFPTTRLVTRAQIALGADLTQPPTSWAWADITNYVRQDLGISWSTGRPDGSGQVGYGSAQLKLDNRDGRFSRRNPNSPYFGLLTRNTPIWVTVDAGSGVRDRIQMFVNEWPVRWSDESATDSTVTIRCSGTLRRLGQAGGAKSALRRHILSEAEPTPVAYWPMEDGTGATSVASGLPGGTAMTGTPVFTSGFGGSEGSIDLAATTDRALSVGIGLPDANGFQVEFVYATTSSIFPIAVYCGSNIVGNGPTLTPTDALPHHYSVSYVQMAGGGIVFSEYNDGVLTNCAVMGLGAFTLASTLSIVVRNGSGNPGNLAHLVVYKFADVTAGAAFLGPPAIVAPLGSPATRTPAANGYLGELATTRIRRVAAEQGVPMVCTSGLSQAMGAQPVDTFVNILRDAEAVDGGVLYETAWGLGFQALNDRTNMPVSLALDFNQKHIADTPEPADDDQRLRNKWTVSRPGGSSYVQELTTGQTGTALAGVYDGSATVNVQLDSQLADQAGWRLNIGTADGDRWPSLPLNFTRNPTLIDTWTTLPYGQRMTVSNPPAQMPPDTLNLVIEGFSEAWTPFNWFATLNASPFAPYRIGIVSDPAAIQEVPRIGSATATLAADISTTDTSLSVTTGTGGLWTTAAADFPLDVNIGGERIRLSGISGAASPQTFTVSARSVNGIVKAHAAGDRVEVWQLVTVGLS